MNWKPPLRKAGTTIKHLNKDCNIVGNTYDKYGSSNPLARYLMDGFLRNVTTLYNRISPVSVLEVGCGEGKLIRHLLNSARQVPAKIVACDLSLHKIEANPDAGITFQEASIYDLPFEKDEFDLVVCCEVLEHLEEPSQGLSEVARVAGKGVLLSTPREPLWRILNLCRGKYLGQLGNTPGHIQNFSQSELISLAESHLQSLTIRAPIPWTIVLGTPK